MKTAVIYFPGTKRREMHTVAKSLAEGIELQGHDVDLFDGELDIHTELTMYNYVVVGCHGTSLAGGKGTDPIRSFFSKSGKVAGKKSCVFCLKKSFRPEKTLTKLTKLVQHEGLSVRNKAIVKGKDEALAVGQELIIES